MTQSFDWLVPMTEDRTGLLVAAITSLGVTTGEVVPGVLV
jgi:hypothetical protein